MCWKDARVVADEMVEAKKKTWSLEPPKKSWRSGNHHLIDAKDEQIPIAKMIVMIGKDVWWNVS